MATGQDVTSQVAPVGCRDGEHVAGLVEHVVSPVLQLNLQQLGAIPSPILPANVTGELDLTQSLAGPADNGTAATRGYAPIPNPYGTPYISNSSQVWLPCSLPGVLPLCWHVPVMRGALLLYTAHVRARTPCVHVARVAHKLLTATAGRGG